MYFTVCLYVEICPKSVFPPSTQISTQIYFRKPKTMSDRPRLKIFPSVNVPQWGSSHMSECEPEQTQTMERTYSSSTFIIHAVIPEECLKPAQKIEKEGISVYFQTLSEFEWLWLFTFTRLKNISTFISIEMKVCEVYVVRFTKKYL